MYTVKLCVETYTQFALLSTVGRKPASSQKIGEGGALREPPGILPDPAVPVTKEKLGYGPIRRVREGRASC